MNYFEEYNKEGKLAYLVTEYDPTKSLVVYHIKLYNCRRRHKIFKHRDDAIAWLVRHDFVSTY